MPAKKQKRTQAQRRTASIQRILEASKELIGERGYDRFSLQDVGHLAGCSYELVNHYFGNKDGLLAAVADHIVERFSMVSHDLPQQRDPFDNLAQWIRYYMNVADRDFATFRAYMRIASEAPFHPQLLELVVNTRRNTMAAFSEAIKQGQAADVFREEVDAEEYARIIYEFLRGHTDVKLLQGAAAEGGAASAASVCTASVEAFTALLKGTLKKEKPSRRAARGQVVARRTRRSMSLST